MNIFEVILIALSLSADCFAVSISGSISVKKYTYIQVIRTAFAFGFFQFLMPLLGWFAGRTVVDIISSFDHWIAFGLLAIVGGRMIWESFKDEDEGNGDITRGLLLLTLAFATSIDSLAAGLSFAFLDINIWMACSIIGIVAFVATLIGFFIGSKAGLLLGKRAKLLGGIILIAIGLRILLTHIL